MCFNGIAAPAVLGLPSANAFVDVILACVIAFIGIVQYHQMKMQLNYSSYLKRRIVCPRHLLDLTKWYVSYV
jgi:hypothetical protein